MILELARSEERLYNWTYIILVYNGGHLEFLLKTQFFVGGFGRGEQVCFI